MTAATRGALLIGKSSNGSPLPTRHSSIPIVKLTEIQQEPLTWSWYANDMHMICKWYANDVQICFFLIMEISLDICIMISGGYVAAAAAAAIVSNLAPDFFDFDSSVIAMLFKLELKFYKGSIF